MTTADLIGQRFGRLTVLERVGSDKHRHALWRCVCDCGEESAVVTGNLRRGTRSCGCLRREALHDLYHGKVHRWPRRIDHPREYATWWSMRRRCGVFGPGNPKYVTRGIDLNWASDFDTFLDYVLEHLGCHPGAGWTIDRVDNNHGYFPGNIRWATARMQANNRRQRQSQRVSAILPAAPRDMIRSKTVEV